MAGDFAKGLWQIVSQRSVQRRLARVFTHPVVLLAIATIFATLAGAWLTNYYQEQAWVRDKQFQVQQYTFDQALSVIDDLSEAMSRRLFGLNRVVWVAKGTGTGTLDETWDAYYESVVDWNVQLARYRSRLSRFVGREAGEGYFTGVHGTFLETHETVRALVDCVRSRCQAEARQAALAEAEQALNTMGQTVDGFLELCTDLAYGVDLNSSRYLP